MRNPRNESLGSDTIDEGRARRGSRNAVSERRCIVTGEVRPREDLVRLALSPDHILLPDVSARAPGRGAWIGISRAQLAAAMASGQLRGALARGFKGAKVDVPEDLPDLIEKALRQALAARLGLELRAGRLILGSDRIAGEARMGRVAALYHAADAAEDGARRLDQALRVGSGEEGSALAGERLPLDRAALSVALGRENVVHIALADQASAQRIVAVLRRLQNFVKAESGSDQAADGGDRAADEPACGNAPAT